MILEWQKDLYEMIFAFEYASTDEHLCKPPDEDFARAQSGLRIFAKNYFSLWF